MLRGVKCLNTLHSADVSLNARYFFHSGFETSKAERFRKSVLQIYRIFQLSAHNNRVL